MQRPFAYAAQTLGDRARQAGLWPVARRMYRLTLDADPSLAHIWVQYGHALQQAGQLGEAEAAYLRSLSLLPDFADTHRQLGHVLKRQGRLTEAEAAYTRAWRLDPELDDIRQLLQEVRLAIREQRQAAIAAAGPEEQRRFYLNNLLFGTTGGLCNASCLSCPTGKAVTSHLPRTTMPLDLFEKVVREIALDGYRIGNVTSGSTAMPFWIPKWSSASGCSERTFRGTI